MDTSTPAVFVNGGLLRTYVGRRVRTVIQVIQSDSGGVTAKSTDDHQLIVKGSQPPLPLTTFVEVIGIADSDRSIRAEMWTNFGNTFEMWPPIDYQKLTSNALNLQIRVGDDGVILISKS